MEKIINYESLKSFAYVNDAIIKQPINGIVISFFGLNNISMYDIDIQEGEFYAESGVLYVVPYNNPWAWMNRQAVAYTDEIVDVLIEHYALPDNIPIVSTGGSMGGQGALVYTAYSKRTPCACVANCPVCDVVFHFTERPDLPRTLYSALFNYEGTLDDALKSISPVHLVEKMPRTKYHIFHCNADKSVNIDAHSNVFVEKMRAYGHNISYDIVDGRGHCKLTLEMKRKFAKYALDAIKSDGAIL